ncbi:MAG: 30S ribosomal protein S8 [Myxococcota bacterium]|nr:30S ribosomal protein S8 [Myxococcota bacterium]
MLTDPIGDMLARIRNAGQAGHPDTSCPASKQKLAVANVLKEKGYLEDVREEEIDGHPGMRLVLRYGDEGQFLIDGLRRVSKPSRRVYVGAKEVPKVRNGLGTAVLSTNLGVISDDEARSRSVGGEVVCEVW